MPDGNDSWLVRLEREGAESEGSVFGVWFWVCVLVVYIWRKISRISSLETKLAALEERVSILQWRLPSEVYNGPSMEVWKRDPYWNMVMGCNSSLKPKVFIQTFPERTVSIDVQPTDTVETLKSKVQESQGILPAQQRLIYGDKLLENGRTLADYQIINRSIIYLTTHFRAGWPILVKLGNGEDIYLNAHEFTTGREIKSMIRSLKGIAIEYQDLYNDDDEAVGDVDRLGWYNVYKEGFFLQVLIGGRQDPSDAITYANPQDIWTGSSDERVMALQEQSSSYTTGTSSPIVASDDDPAPVPVANDTQDVINCNEDDCVRTFTDMTSYKQHLRYHTKPKMCPYDNCAAGFGTITHLKRHINSIHKTEARYYCEVPGCKYSESQETTDEPRFFKRKDNLARHRLQRHPALPTPMDEEIVTGREDSLAV